MTSPNFRHPVTLAKEAMTLDDISGGRLSINVVSGWFLPELEALGVTLLDHDDRYAHTREWLDTVTALWAGKQVAVGAGGGQPALARPLPRSVPPIYVGGESDPGRALAAETADVFFINGRPLADTEAVIADLRSRRESARAGAPLRFGLSAFVIARDTDDEAEAEASHLQSLVDAERRPEISGGTDPKTQMYKVLADTSRVGSNGGTLAGLVGSYGTVAERISAFHDAGIELFMLQFQPLETELERFAEHLIPRFR